MLPIGNDELEAIRAELEVLLPDTCAILAQTQTRGTDGGVTVTWGTATASVACRFDPLTGTEQTAAGGIQAFQGYKVTLPHDCGVTTSSRLLRGGVTYNVISVDSGKSLAASLRLVVQKV